MFFQVLSCDRSGAVGQRDIVEKHPLDKNKIKRSLAGKSLLMQNCKHLDHQSNDFISLMSSDPNNTKLRSQPASGDFHWKQSQHFYSIQFIRFLSSLDIKDGKTLHWLFNPTWSAPPVLKGDSCVFMPPAQNHSTEPDVHLCFKMFSPTNLVSNRHHWTWVQLLPFLCCTVTVVSL